MKISAHFTDSEFLSPLFLAKIKSKGLPSTRYINPRLVDAAEFIRSFLNTFYKNNDRQILSVSMTGNKAGVSTRGLRSFWDVTSSSWLSDHRYLNAFDCDVVIKYRNGSKKEADYREIQRIILDNEQEFMAAGISMIEDVTIANTWLHFSIAWLPNEQHIKVIS